MDKTIEPGYSKVKKKDFLAGVKVRLENDVKIYIEAVENESKKGNHVGFFGSIRLLMPTIEALAVTIYRGHKRKKIYRLLENLEIEYPELVWQCFRHSIIHRDTLGIVKYRGEEVSWSCSVFGMKNIFQQGQLHIDSKTLYLSLLDFLDNEIANCGNESVYVQVGVRFKSNLRAETKKELQGIFS